MLNSRRSSTKRNTAPTQMTSASTSSRRKSSRSRMRWSATRAGLFVCEEGRATGPPAPVVLVVSRNAFDALVMFLGFQGHGRDRPRLKACQRDRVAGHFAIAIFAFEQAADGGVDLRDQLALPVARPELDRPVGL